MPVHAGPTYVREPPPREPPCTPEPVGGGEAVPRRGPGGPWLGRPLRRLTIRAPKVARTVSITPPPGHYEPGAVGLHRRSERSDRRAVSDRTAAWRTSRTKNRAGRQATGILKTKSSRRPGGPLPRYREAVPTRSSARKDRESDDARPQAPDLPASRHRRTAPGCRASSAARRRDLGQERDHGGAVELAVALRHQHAEQRSRLRRHRHREMQRAVRLVQHLEILQHLAGIAAGREIALHHARID